MSEIDIPVEVLNEYLLVFLGIQLRIDALEPLLDVAVDGRVELINLIDHGDRSGKVPVRRVAGLDLSESVEKYVHLFPAVAREVAVHPQGITEYLAEQVRTDLVEDFLVSRKAPDVVFTEY